MYTTFICEGDGIVAQLKIGWTRMVSNLFFIQIGRIESVHSTQLVFLDSSKYIGGHNPGPKFAGLRYMYENFLFLGKKVLIFGQIAYFWTEDCMD
jgi:hypothetical protein